MRKYLIGIDLGTTNSTMAYTLLQEVDGEGVIEQFAIPQLVSAGTMGEGYALPSFLYVPLAEEKAKKIAEVEWQENSPYCVGIFARDRGGEVATRVVSSAKSWLCHAGIDRRAAILPIDGDEDLQKISPLEACAAFLRHLKEAWDDKMPKAPFAQQEVLITVPASFDPSARQLVLEAADLAGYPEVILLEEPQAAFYAWLHRHEGEWRKQLHVGDQVLVVDIGGGTSDFSLITVSEEEGDLILERKAVGSHLLLGGDNMDLALAYLVKEKIEEKGKALDSWQMSQLIHQCRVAKEKLFAQDAADSADITLMGRGSKLIGGTIKAKLLRTEAEAVLVDGFIPVVTPQERSVAERMLGLQQVGLPYARDPRLSCQLAKFLSLTGELDSPSMEHFVVPAAVLFNGGTMKGDRLRERLLEVLNAWAESLGQPAVKELSEPDYDFGVSRGAVYYGLARKGKKIRIRAGTSRSYFIGVEEAAPAIPGRGPSLKAICVAPFGMEEGTEVELPQQQFALVVGELATFRFFSHATPQLADGTVPEPGARIPQWKQELSELHPIETRLEKGEKDSKTISVSLKTRVTELGVLELWCVAPDGRKWKLEFDIRQDAAAL